MHQDKRLTKRLISYWENLRKQDVLPGWNKFNPAALADIMGQCCMWKVEISDKNNNSQLYTYEYIGEDVQKALGRDLTGKIFSPNVRPFPAARIVKRINEIVESKNPILDEGNFVNEKNKTIKFRSCLLPFGTKEGEVTNVLLGLSWIEI